MEITIYTTDGCLKCRATAMAFDKHGTPYTMRHLEDHPEVLMYAREQGHLEAPIVIVRTDYDARYDMWSSFRPDKIREYHEA